MVGTGTASQAQLSQHFAERDLAGHERIGSGAEHEKGLLKAEVGHEADCRRDRSGDGLAGGVQASRLNGAREEAGTDAKRPGQRWSPRPGSC